MVDGARSPAATRIAGSLLLLAVTVLLLLPAAPAERPVFWEDILSPLAAGHPITRGYVLSQPRRGEGHDVVYVARRAEGPGATAARIEVHIVDRGRWSGIEETRSFGVGWEVPAHGSLARASEDDARAVTAVLLEAIARNDSGFESVDLIPLESEPPAPLLARILDRLRGVRAAVVGSAVVGIVALLLPVGGGVACLGLLLFVIGMLLRGTVLDLPFVLDQDVQRMLTGNLPITEIVAGAGLRDRHPPLYFLILHLVQQFGQSATLARLPAVVTGALAGPGLLVATKILRGRVGMTAVLAALALTVSPELIARSREVSEIPLFALMLLIAATALVAAIRSPRAIWLVVLAVANILALCTYYLAPFVLVAHAAVLGWRRRLNHRVGVAFTLGVIIGAPVIVLGLVTFLRDRGSREVARAFPALAWGDHSVVQVAQQMGRISIEAFGQPFLFLLLVAIFYGARRRDVTVITASLGAAAAVAGIALLAPLARVQAYYVTTVLPLLALAVAVMPEPEDRLARRAFAFSLALTLALSSLPALSRARSLYIADANAFMPRFADVIRQRPEHRVVTVAHYDKTLLAYYLAQREGRSLNWNNVDAAGTKKIEPLVMVHALGPDSEPAAVTQLEQLVGSQPTLVIERDALLLPGISARLQACTRLAEAPTARLLRCAAPTVP